MKNIFVSLFFIIFITGCGHKEKVEPVTPEQKKIFTYLPDDTEYLVFMDLNELEETPLWGSFFMPSLLSRNNYGSSFDNFEKETGVGLNNGISILTIARTESGENIFLAQFDKNFKRIKKFFDDNFLKINLVNKTVYKTKEDPKRFFYFLDTKTLIVLNDKSYLKDLIENKNKSLLANKNILDIIKKIKYKKQYWAASSKGYNVVNFFKKLLSSHKDLTAEKLLKSVKSVSLSASFNDGIQFDSNWECKNSKDAYLLSTAIKGMLAMDLLSKSNYTLGKILQKTDVERNDKLINFKLELNKNDIKDLKSLPIEKRVEKNL